MKAFLTSIAAAALLTVSTGVGAASLKLGVSAGPYGEILEYTAKIAAKEGLKAEVIEFTDWNMPNAALQSGDIDANNFQHQPFLDNQIKQRGYDIVPVAKSIVVPMGIYAKKVQSLGGMVFITLPLPSWNTVGGGGVIAPSLALPARNSAIGVPSPPGS